MSASSRNAVFLSYASQDAEPARRICEALRAEGIEVWFDAEGGLEHGDEWDAKIRRQVKECLLFIPLISANTQARAEGYFRIEWELAADRAVGIAAGVPFLLPVVLDETREPGALVPERFRRVQWTRLPGGVMSPDARARFARLWAQRQESGAASASAAAPAEARRRLPVAGLLAGVLLAAAIAGWAWVRRGGPASASSGNSAAAASAGPATAPSAARQLAERAFAMSVDSNVADLEDYVAAEGMMQQALQLDANDGEIWARSAELNEFFVNRGFDRSQRRRALGDEQAARAIRLSPDSVEARFAAAFALRDKSDDVAAVGAAFRHVLEIQPDHPRTLLFLALSLFEAGQEQEGTAMLQQVASQNPKWRALANYLLFLRQFTRRHFELARETLRQSFAGGAPVNSNQEGGLAMVEMTWKGDLDAAAAGLAAAPQALQTDPRIVWISSQIQIDRRDSAQALSILDRMPEDFIRDSWFVGPKDYLVGWAHAVAGHSNAARVAWQSALAVTDAQLQTASTNGALHLVRGKLLALLGRDSEALAEAKVVDEMGPRRAGGAAWTDSPVGIYALLGRADLAVPILKEMLARTPSAWPLTPALLRVDPLWDKLRGDPSFATLTRDSN